MRNETASACWERLNGVKQPLMRRIERYASLTIPKICLPDGFNSESTDQTHDFQSIGAQAVNHVTNKLMLALFGPTRPFFKVQPTTEAKKEFAAQGVDELSISPALANMERAAVQELDARAQRPKLYTAVRHLVITGNVLLCLHKDELRIMGMKYFCVKRTAMGKVHTLVIKECVKYDELDTAVQVATAGRYQPDSEVHHYRHLTLDANGDMLLTQWINSEQLPKQFNGKWPVDECPYKVLTWDLADESDYATGLVEEYAGDFESLSALAEGVVDGAILSMEFRWLVNPTGSTRADDLNRSKNGDALAGLPADIAPTQGGNPQAVDFARALLKDFEQRVARGFLLNSAVTRDAERVTAEEIRITAMELETAFGGVYSTLAAGVQRPIATWLLDLAGYGLKNSKFAVVIVTGLDALSRNGDLENLRLALGDLAQMTSLPPQVQDRIDFPKIVGFIGQGRGVDLAGFLISEEDYEAKMKQRQIDAIQAQSAIEGGKAGAQAAAQPGA